MWETSNYTKTPLKLLLMKMFIYDIVIKIMLKF